MDHLPLTYQRVGRWIIFSDGTRLPVVAGGAPEGEATELTELLAQAQDVSGLDDDALATLDTDITAAAIALAEGDVDDEALAQIEAAGTAVQAIRAEQEGREQAATERAERAQAALALINGQTEDEGDGEGDGEATGDEEPAEGDAPAEGEDHDTTTEAEADQTPEQLAASSPALPARRPLTRVAARRPASVAPRPSSTPASPFAASHIVASANAPGLGTGQRINNYEELARGFVSAIAASKGYRGPTMKLPIFTVGRGLEEYPESHRLDSNTAQNTLRIERTRAAIRANGGLQAALRNNINAAGGICAPSEVRYDLPGIEASDARPVRDGFFTRYGATRGGVRTLPGPVLEDLNGASSWWTNANDIDAAPDGIPSKPCLRVTCANTEDETLIEAAVMCLKYGNFMARYFPERIARWMELMEAAHARLAEIKLLAALSTGATSVLTIPTMLGSVRDLLTGLDRIRAQWNYRHRTPDSFTLGIVLPRWLRDQIRTDVTRQLPVGSVTETLSGLTDEQIDALIRARNFEPTWAFDGETGQTFPAAGATGTVAPWPSTVRTYIAPAGDWLHLDGGELTLGIMRDTVTTATNDVQFFAETMEAPHFHGIESWVVTFDTCPDGSVGATKAIDPCATGV